MSSIVNMLPLSPLPRKPDSNECSYIATEDQISAMMRKENSSIYYVNCSDKKQCNRRLTSCWLCRQTSLQNFDNLSISEEVQYVGNNISNSQINPSSKTGHSCDDDNDLLLADEICRLRMSDWCYKICDYIGASREIVAVAFNYLDRFLTAEKYSW